MSRSVARKRPHESEYRRVLRGRSFARPFTGCPVARAGYLAEEVTEICGRSLFTGGRKKERRRNGSVCIQVVERAKRATPPVFEAKC